MENLLILNHYRYISLCAYQCDSATVCIGASSLQRETDLNSIIFQSSALGSISKTQEEIQRNADLQTEMRQCEHCKKDVPNMSYIRHVAFCARHNTVCDKCGRTLRKTQAHLHFHCDLCEEKGRSFICDSQHARNKHMDLLHSSIPCDCGATLDLIDLQQHKTNVRSNLCQTG